MSAEKPKDPEEFKANLAARSFLPKNLVSDRTRSRQVRPYPLMQVAHTALAAVAWLLALAWLSKLIEAARGLPTVPNLLAPEYDRMPAGSPSIAIIVPARDEAPNIAACLESLRAQDYANLQVLAVNDRSTDATGAIMDSLASANSTRITVLHIRELPANWLGKNHAMALAAEVILCGETICVVVS